MVTDQGIVAAQMLARAAYSALAANMPQAREALAAIRRLSGP